MVVVAVLLILVKVVDLYACGGDCWDDWCRRVA